MKPVFAYRLMAHGTMEEKIYKRQFSGINGVLNYTPQILEQAGVGVLLSNMGISSTSASLLISAIMTLLMLPCIAVAMRLMDVSGRRNLLLSTIPVLIATLVVLVIGSILIATLVVLVIGSILIESEMNALNAAAGADEEVDDEDDE